MNEILNVHVVYGGKSAEHEVSLKTALNVLNRMDKRKYNVYPVYITRHGIWRILPRLDHALASTAELETEAGQVDGNAAASMGNWLTRRLAENGPHLVFPVIHGTCGEDGTLQGMLELADVPYVGNGVLASAAGMDKVMMKRIFTGAGIPQVEYEQLLRHEWEQRETACCDALERTIGYPCYVKPANLGSSIGIRRCADRDELLLAIGHAFRYDRKIIIEKEAAGREVQLAVLGNDRPICSVAGEFARGPDFFDYYKKYEAGNLVQRIPAQLAGSLHEQLREYALQAYRLLDGSGLMRIDFFVTDQGEIYLNEVNTLPGFTPISMFPALWEKTDGTTYAELIDKLIGLALERHEQKRKIRYGREDV